MAVRRQEKLDCVLTLMTEMGLDDEEELAEATLPRQLLCSAIMRLRLQKDIPDSAWNTARPSHMDQEEWDSIKRQLNVGFSAA